MHNLFKSNSRPFSLPLW